MNREFGVLIVGAGHGGAQAAAALRQQGYVGSIALIGREPELPYERPPLSKEYLARDKPFERIMLRPAAFWAAKAVDMLLGIEVIAVEPARKRVMLSDGSMLGYESLVWAAGGAPRRLACEGAGLAGVHVVRDKADIDRIMADLDNGARRATIVGGGYIGLEAAAVLSKLGCKVTLIEALDRVLARVAGKPLSRFFEAEHRDHGVDLRLKTLVDRIEGSSGRVTGVRLADGELIPCDLVIVGIGVEPTVGPLELAGAQVSNGVEVDAFCRTSLPDVYAIGDCAAHENAYAEGRRIRLESVQNANDMAITCAKAICSVPEPYSAVPWFWSNQYDLKLQTVGLSQGFDAAVVRGNMASRSFSVIYLKAGNVIALDCVNAVKDYVQGRKLVQARVAADSAALADPATPLGSLV